MHAMNSGSRAALDIIEPSQSLKMSFFGAPKPESM
jgi:hypothetical protein